MSDCKHEAALRDLGRFCTRMMDGSRAHVAFAAADHIAAQRAEIARLTRERNALCGIALRHAAELVRLRYSGHAGEVAERIKSNRRVMLEAIDRDCEVQRLAGIALKTAIDKALAAEGAQ